MPKGIKDPYKVRPKRGLSAFMFFSKETRPKIVAENPDMKFGQIGKTIGEMWRAMDDEQKKPYQDMAEEDKARYDREMKHFTPPSVEEILDRTA